MVFLPPTHSTTKAPNHQNSILIRLELLLLWAPTTPPQRVRTYGHSRARLRNRSTHRVCPSIRRLSMSVHSPPSVVRPRRSALCGMQPWSAFRSPMPRKSWRFQYCVCPSISPSDPLPTLQLGAATFRKPCRKPTTANNVSVSLFTHPNLASPSTRH